MKRFLILSLLFLTACQTSTHNEGEQPSTPSKPIEYGEMINEYTAGKEAYNGFYNHFEFLATLQNSFISDILLKRQADYYKWEDSKLASERDKAVQEMSTHTKIFVSFFTPDKHNDNLTDAKSIWRVFLDSGGKRYVGKVKKFRKLLAELVELYPYHTRWNTPYILEFDVPTSAIEGSTSTLTITGPLGTRSADFKALERSGI